MIATSKPLTRRFKLMLAAVLIAVLGVSVVQVAAAQPQSANKHTKLKVRMINPFYQGIAVKPSNITYFNWQKEERVNLSQLTWESWNGSQAVAVGQMNGDSQAEVTLSAQRKCGMPNFRFYTRITVGVSTYPLPCRVQVLSGSDIGTAAEDVSAYGKPTRKYIYVGSNKASLMEGKWRRLGAPVATASGVSISWWNGTDWHWVASKLTLSKLGYCPQVGSIVYYKVRLTTYGSGVPTGSMPIRRAAHTLRKQVGKAAPRHTVKYNYRKWCKRKRYPSLYWTPWE